QIDCDGNPGTTETSCTFTGDQTGALPVGGPIVPSPAAFNVACVPPELGGISGLVGTCTAVTTDGDIDCNKTKVVSFFCETIPPCLEVGCPAGVDCAFCDDGNDCTSDICDDSFGTLQCPNDPLPAGTSCPDFAPQPGECDGAGACQAQGCASDADCPAPTACTGQSTCDVGGTFTCQPAPPINEGGSCDTGLGTCQSGTCVDNCTGVTCDDGNECTADSCDNSTNPGTCSNTGVPDGTACNGGFGICFGGFCGIFESPPVASVAIDMCCNNNASPQQSIIPIRLDVDLGVVVPGGTFTAQFGGELIFPESFLDAQQVVPTGMLQADLIAAQVTVLARGPGVTGAPVPLQPVFPPGTCLIGGSSCDVANDVGGIHLGSPGYAGNTDCVPIGIFNPCERLITVPTSTSLATCQSLDSPECSAAGSGFCSDGVTACTSDGDCTSPDTCALECTKTDQYNLNGYCVTGPLPIPLQVASGTFTAGSSGQQILFGWSDDPVATNSTLSGGVVTIAAPAFSGPLYANELKVLAGGLAVAINCTMAVETGDPLTDPVTCGTTPDSLLVGAATGSPAGNQDYTIP
ncbi:MAG: hypothetical protein WAU39_19970, partial [Polyangiales bacterium]